ncbi:MAG: AraC family transcriptional regulator [Bacteroidales bacterium]|nr:AraC family transcriptional regulator [Bacteroidales bacterium]MCM1147400.1 AraC family transcriptional regulator [Bacteroidales bacterium]MCM1206069.1 AraC family transcriptional regulator [Bacillota bacterium]MCM1510100.1 AraC family transcriptional regulator [Clostridium sp.]
MIDFDLPEEKQYSARISRQRLMDIRAGVHKYVFVGRRYRNINFTAAELARNIGTNTRYLSAAIRLHYGCNFPELVNKLRVEEAKQIMLDPRNTLTMEDISYSAGFSTRQSFYNAFNKFVGMKPKEWLAQEKEKKRMEEERQREQFKAGASFEGIAFE